MSAELVVSGVPTVVAERLSGIYRDNSDLNERAVLEDARSDDSSLHGYFEWDDGVAAEAHRLTQAAPHSEGEGDGNRRARGSADPRSGLHRPSGTDGQRGKHRARFLHRDWGRGWANVLRGVSARVHQARPVRLRKKYEDTDALFDLAAEVFAA